MSFLKRISVVLLFALSPLAHAGPVGQSLTLNEAYELALKQSETVAIEAEQIREAEAHFRQALSGILPDVSYNISKRWQGGDRIGTGNNFTLREVPEQKFTFSQPLFSGFKEFIAMSAGRAERRQFQFELERARQLLFIDVMDAFYLALNYQQNIETLQSIRKILTERRDELVKRQGIGRTRESEVASAEARLSQIEADLIELENNRTITFNLLEFLTGTEVDRLVGEPTGDASVLKPEVYIEKAEDRPDVKAAEEAYNVARKNVRIAQADFLPTVNADGNYYTERVGNSAAVEWDTTLTVSIPLFQGGEILANVQERASERRQAELTYQRTLRSAKREIKDALAEHSSALRVEAALDRAVAATERNYELQVRDYNSSLVDNLDVMNALEDVEVLRRRYIDAQTQTDRSYWRLLAAVGELP